MYSALAGACEYSIRQGQEKDNIQMSYRREVRQEIMREWKEKLICCVVVILLLAAILLRIAIYIKLFKFIS